MIGMQSVVPWLSGWKGSLAVWVLHSVLLALILLGVWWVAFISALLVGVVLFAVSARTPGRVASERNFPSGIYLYLGRCKLSSGEDLVAVRGSDNTIQACVSVEGAFDEKLFSPPLPVSAHIRYFLP